MNELYVRIEELCRKNNINITELCKQCSIPRAQLSDFKMGRIKTLSALTLSKIAQYFGISMEYLSSGVDATPSEENLKVALFGGGIEVTDEMWNEVKRYAEYVRDRDKSNED